MLKFLRGSLKSNFIFLFLYFLFPTTNLANPIEISNCEELQAIRNDLSGDYKLVGNEIYCWDIDNFIPIGKPYNEFTGHFDGNHVPIKWLTI